MNSQPNILPPNAMQYNVSNAIDIVLDDHTVGMTDARSQSLSRSLVDTVIQVDSLTKSITDKRLSDTVKLNEWFSIKENPQSNDWSD